MTQSIIHLDSAERGVAFSRRGFLGSVVLTAGALSATGTVWALARNSPAVAAGDQHLLQILGDLVIPTTDTPGAGSPDIAQFVIVALAHGLEKGSPELLSKLEEQLDKTAKGSFISGKPTKRYSVLKSIDAAAFADEDLASVNPPWRVIKRLILIGYYTSETGGSKELQYDPIPGRLDPDVPVTSSTRAYSSDWQGVGR